MSNFETIGIIGKQGEASNKVWETLDRLVKCLRAFEREVFFDDVSGTKVAAPKERIVGLREMGQCCSLVIVVGGDGTLLHAARAMAEFQVPLVGVNLGRLGFLADILPKEIETGIERILAGDYMEEPRCMLQVRVESEKSGLRDSCLALNDVVVHRRDSARVIELETYIEGVFVNAQRSDAIIVATPTGSTAYALSGGGPLIHPALDVLAVVPICPHTLSNRPLVIAGDSHIEIRIGERDRDQVIVTYDGLTAPHLEAPARVFIDKTPRPARLLHLTGHDHYKILRAKLGWGGPVPCPQLPGDETDQADDS